MNGQEAIRSTSEGNAIGRSRRDDATRHDLEDGPDAATGAGMIVGGDEPHTARNQIIQNSPPLQAVVGAFHRKECHRRAEEMATAIGPSFECRGGVTRRPEIGFTAVEQWLPVVDLVWRWVCSLARPSTGLAKIALKFVAF